MVEVTTEHEHFPPPSDRRELLRDRGSDRLLDDDADVAASDLLAGLPRPPLTASAADVVAAPVHRSN